MTIVRERGGGWTDYVSDPATFADLRAGRAILRESDTGPLVAEMQGRLLASGYDVGPDGADGVFGFNTKAALELYQYRNGLDCERGFVGPETTASLWGDPAGVVPGPMFSSMDAIRGPAMLPEERATIARVVEPVLAPYPVDPMLAASMTGVMAATMAMNLRPNYALRPNYVAPLRPMPRAPLPAQVHPRAHPPRVAAQDVHGRVVQSRLEHLTLGRRR